MRIIQPGDTLLGRYTVLDKLGEGGMAEIFRAATEGAAGFRKLVAVKRILENFALHEKFRTMFVSEARLAALLEHPNIVQIHAFDEDAGSLILVMEYLAGCDLRGLLGACAQAGEQLPLPAALWVATEFLRGLDYAHKKRDSAGEPLGLVHRDVSPSNVLVSFEGIVKLSDFGIAKASFIPSITQQGHIKGKISYMAPETVSGGKVDARADLWAAGVVLWEMLATRRLFQGEQLEVVQAISQGEVPSLATLRPDLDPGIVAAVHSALRVDPDHRVSSAAELAGALTLAAARLDMPLTAESLQDEVRGRFATDLQRHEALLRGEQLEPPTVEATAVGAAAAERTDETATTAARPSQVQPVVDPTTDATLATQDLGPVLAAPADAPLAPRAPAAAATPAPTLEPSLSPGPAPVLSSRLMPPAPDPRARRRQSSPWLFVVASLLAVVLAAAGLMAAGKLMEPKTGALVLASDPAGARVWLDGAALEVTTPCILQDLPPGPHQLRLEQGGSRPEQLEVRVEAGRRTEVQVELTARGASGGEDGGAAIARADAGGADRPEADARRPDAAVSELKATADAAGAAVAVDAPVAAVDSSRADPEDGYARLPGAAIQQYSRQPSGSATSLLSLWIKPAGSVEIDGKPLITGKLLTRERLQPGTHLLRVYNRYLRREVQREIQLGRGEHLRLRVNLTGPLARD